MPPGTLSRATELDIQAERGGAKELADELGHAHPAQLLRVISMACTEAAWSPQRELIDDSGEVVGRPACMPACLAGWLGWAAVRSPSVRRASSAPSQSVATAMDCAGDGTGAHAMGAGPSLHGLDAVVKHPGHL